MQFCENVCYDKKKKTHKNNLTLFLLFNLNAYIMSCVLGDSFSQYE